MASIYRQRDLKIHFRNRCSRKHLSLSILVNWFLSTTGNCFRPRLEDEQHALRKKKVKDKSKRQKGQIEEERLKKYIKASQCCYLTETLN